MHLSFVLAFAGLATPALCNTVSHPRSISTTCQLLKTRYPNITLTPVDQNYTAESQVPWNKGAWLSPACILTPSSATELSRFVQLLSATRTQFAMRGGGHMFIPSAANIGPEGVLISSTKLNTLSLSADLQTVSVGPGPRWGDVYVYLASTGTGKMVVGGRYSPVGVPGLLLGGGISFYSSKYGFASGNGNIRGMECVLADGRIAYVTATNRYKDLYWALLGGGNSYCLVTRFDLRTFDSPVQSIADAHYGTGEAVKKNFIEAIHTYALSGSEDTKAAVIPVVRLGHGEEKPTYDNLMFYDGNTSSPAIFKDFQGGKLQGNGTALRPIGLGRFSQAVKPAFEKGGESFGLQQKFYLVAIKADIEAMTIVHDIYFAGIKKLKDLDKFFTGLAFLAITTSFTEAANAGIGTPQGLANEPVIWVEQALTWGRSEDDKLVNQVLGDINAEIQKVLSKKGQLSKYLYLNDASENQKVFESYPKENLRKLKAIRAKYDPSKVYTNLMKGGFKVDKASL